MVWKQDRWRCSFTDRYHQRVDMRWRKLRYAPNLGKMLERHQEKEQKEKTVELAGQPEGWKGALRKVEGGWVVNAGRFFEGPKLLVEMIIVWPGARDQRLENSILRSVRPLDIADGMRCWQAMGMKVHMGAEYDIIEYKVEPGRTEWVFGREKKRGARVAVERIAMPGYWLKGTIKDWLRSKAEGWKMLDEWQGEVSGHEAAGLKAYSQGLLVDSLLLKKRVKSEVAWLCDKEQRVYRISCTATQRSKKDVAVPENIEVLCCQRPPIGKED